MTLVIKDVSTNCGEAYFEPDVTDTLLEMLNAAVASGVQVEVCAYPIVLAS